MEQKQSAGAIWKKTIKTKNGPMEILSITIEGKRYSAWPNTYKKEGEKSPDYRVQVDNYEPKPQSATQSARQVEDNSGLPF